jgi:hypothetical protein
MQSVLTLRDTRKLTGVVQSDRKRPLKEVTFIFNEQNITSVLLK